MVTVTLQQRLAPAARLTASCKLPFTQHVPELDTGEGGLRGVKRFEP
jgi:hypothetical protein